MRKPLTTVPQTSARFGHEGTRKPANRSYKKKDVCTFVQQYGFPVLPLEDLVNHPLNLVGLGRKCTSPLGFIILHVQVREITGYDKDVVFLVVPDEPEVTVRGSICLGPFQTKIIEGQVKPLFGDMAHVMITPLKAGEGQPAPCSPHIHVPQEWQWQSLTHG